MLGWLVEVIEAAIRILVSHFESATLMTLQSQSSLSTLMICLVLACLSLLTIAFSQPYEGSRSIRSLVQRTTARTVRLASSTVPWWEDLSPPFSLPDEDHDDDDPSHPAASAAAPKSRVVHFCFLVHGHRGLGKDLSYLQMVMQRGAERERRRRWKMAMTNAQSNHNHHHHHHHQRMIVHTCCCNEKKTDDGVANGGDRLMQEMLTVMRREMMRDSHDTEDVEITVSMVGNSLGGIYARYAVAELAKACRIHQDKNIHELSLDGQYPLHFNVFCTTATPHLGVSKHTYLPLPRSAEIRVARALGDTGRDLFRINTLLKSMATKSHFLKPLSQFRKRVAYANAYGTDFPVPATTAAFLSTNSTYPHHFEEDDEEDITLAATTTTTTTTTSTTLEQESSPTTVGMLSNDSGESKTNEITDTIRYFKDNIRIATLHTKAQDTTKTTTRAAHDDDDDHYYLHHHRDQDTITATAKSPEEREQDLVQMSTCLDSLGWKKVFIDVRKEIPLRLSLPKGISLRKNWLLLGDSCTSFGATTSTTSSSDHDRQDEAGIDLVGLSPTTTTNEDDNDDESVFQEPACIHTLRQRGEAVHSRDVASALSLPLDNELSFPIGHNLMVAMSRDRLSTLINKGGRPVMDALAKELVEDIFAWETAKTTVSTK